MANKVMTSISTRTITPRLFYAFFVVALTTIHFYMKLEVCLFISDIITHSFTPSHRLLISLHLYFVYFNFKILSMTERR